MIEPGRIGIANTPDVHCRGKQAFPSFALAAEVGSRPRRKGNLLKPYKCPTCGQFHLANPKRGHAHEIPNRRKTGGARQMRHHYEDSEA